MAEAGGDAPKTTRQVYELGQGCELRIEWSPVSLERTTATTATTTAVGSQSSDSNKKCCLKLVKGTAEVFGTEIAVRQKVEVYGQNIACFTYHGATLELEYVDDADTVVPVVYSVEADETPQLQYANLHSALEKKRESGNGKASDGGSGGPRCLIAGPVDMGKSTLTRILINYAVRAGNTPVLVDLDMGQSMITVPGTISAVLVEDVADIKRGVFQCDNVLSFFYGHASPSENMDYYKTTVERLATVLDSFLSSESNALASSSGIFVNTMGWIDGQGYDLLLHAIDKLKIDTVLVIGHDRLYSQLLDQFVFTEKDPARAEKNGKDRRKVEIVKVTRSGGVVSRDSSHRKLTRERKIRSYFYGYDKELSPFSRSIQLSQISVYRVGGGPKAPLSALPIGTATRDADDKMKVQKISVQRDLTHSILAVSHAKDPSEILHSNVAGFIHVTEVDVQRGTLTYLSPSPSALPSPILLAGTVKCFL